MKKILLCIAIPLFLVSCSKDPIGTACERTGDGFTAHHNCKTLCMSIWKISCPDGSIGDSNVCGGELGCTRGSCPADQVCYQTNMDRSICVPQSICPGWSDPSTHPKVELKFLKSKNTPNKPTAPVAPL